MSTRSQFEGQTPLILVVLLPALLLFYLVFVYPIERRALLYSTPFATSDQLETREASQVVQTFAPGVPFNFIRFSVFKASGETVTCRYSLRNLSNDEELASGELDLRGSPLSVESLWIPKEHSLGEVRLELSSSSAPFRFLVVPSSRSLPALSTEIDGEIVSELLLFEIHQRARRETLFSLLYRNKDARIKQAGLAGLALLVAIQLYCLISFKKGIRPLEQTGPRASPASVVFVSAISFVIVLVGIAWILQNNTHSKLLGAEDDAFITYRYAGNLASGNGLVFNLGEKVLGTTAPLFAVILGLSGFIGSSIPVTSAVISLASILVSAVLVYLLLSKNFSEFAALSGAVMFALFPPFYRVLGMETNAVIMMLLAAIHFFVRERFYAAACLMALATLTRPDSVVLLALLCLVLIFKRRFKQLCLAGVLYISVLLPFLLYAQWNYGSYLPNTLYAKTLLGFPRSAQLFVRRVMSFFTDGFLWGAPSYLEGVLEHSRLWLAVFLCGLVLSGKRLFHIFPGIALLAGVVYLLAYHVLYAPFFIWYFVVPMSMFPAVYALGLDSVTHRLGLLHLRGSGLAALRYITLWCVLGLEVCSLSSYFYGQWYVDHMNGLKRYETFEEISSFVDEYLPADASIAMEEIGIVGFGCGNWIWDLYSLVHRADYLPFHFPAESPHRIPYLLTIMDPSHLLFHSGRIVDAIWLENYDEIAAFQVNDATNRYLFYYSLFRKGDRLVVLGDADQPVLRKGDYLISGWCFGVKKIDRVELRVDGRSIAEAGIEVSGRDLEEFASNRFADRAVFRMRVNRGVLAEGIHEAEFWAKSEDAEGIFWRGTFHVTAN